MGYDVGKQTVFEFLKRGKYTIPPIQRRYSWTTEQQERLWKDLENFYEDDFQDFYLLHTVITVQEHLDDRIEILDGQQRTTTMLAMIAAAIDVAEACGQSQTLAFYISRMQDLLRTGADESRLETSYLRDAPMLEWIQTKPILRGKPSRISRVWKAYNFYVSRCFMPIIEKEGAEAGALRILETLYEGMLSECYITVAKFGSMPEAVTAFDTTNNRGKDLTMADLLRYWMLKNAQRHGDEATKNVEEGWTQINNGLEDKEKDIKDFVVRYWCAHLGERYQSTKLLKHLDGVMKTTYTGETELLSLMSEMSRASVMYHALINPSASDPNRRSLRLMRKAGASQHLTTLLAGKMKGFDEHEMAQLINLVERVFFWYQIVAERGGSALYQRYAQWAGALLRARSAKEGLAKVEKEVTDFLATNGLDQEVLQEAFLRLSLDKTQKVMFTLAHIEFQVHPNATLQDEDDMAVHRVAPESTTSGTWPGWNEEGHEEHADLIGNWILLPSSAETLDEGYGPTDVADLAAFCPIRTTAELKDMSAWSIEDILDRQARMFAHAASLWPIA